MMTIRHFWLLPLAVALATACQNDDGNEAAANARAGEGNDAAQASRTIGDSAGQNADLAQFSRAIEAAGLTATLTGTGPYTVFAPVNAAFEAVPEATRTRLMAPEGRGRLTELLTYHIVPGVVTAQDLGAAIQRGGGRATLATMAGPNLTVSREGETLIVTDAAGGRARISRADLIQSNGVIHQVDALLMPGAGETP